MSVGFGEFLMESESRRVTSRRVVAQGGERTASSR
jgi:hypothetical protein